MWRCSSKVACVSQEEGPHWTWHLLALSPCTASLQNYEKQVSVVYKPSSLWYFVMAAPADSSNKGKETSGCSGQREQPSTSPRGEGNTVCLGNPKSLQMPEQGGEKTGDRQRWSSTRAWKVLLSMLDTLYFPLRGQGSHLISSENIFRSCNLILDVQEPTVRIMGFFWVEKVSNKKKTKQKHPNARSKVQGT